MNNRYSRNRIYVRPDEQSVVKNTKILLGGAGIGSIIAECALRFGFENLTIIDGDKVELSNLNRQNYTYSDIGKFKAQTLQKRLLEINPEAVITYHNYFVDDRNIENLIKGHDIAINALDFKSKIPFDFDDICKRHNIPVLHPYNFGWAGFLAVVKPTGIQLSQLTDDPKGFELRMAEYVSHYGDFWDVPNRWLEKIIEEYRNEDTVLPPPQLSIASWIVAGYCVNIMYNLVTDKDVKYFPKFYLSSTDFDRL